MVSVSSADAVGGYTAEYKSDGYGFSSVGAGALSGGDGDGDGAEACWLGDESAGPSSGACRLCDLSVSGVASCGRGGVSTLAGAGLIAALCGATEPVSEMRQRSISWTRL